jgi:ABC-type uncharacterized transport system ATPase subunit
VTRTNTRAGKTTFLNTLSGRAYYGKQSGTISYNGAPHAPSAVKGLSGYVPQDDIVHEDLTVKENVAMAHALRVGFRTARADHNTVFEARSHGACSRCALSLTSPPFVSADLRVGVTSRSASLRPACAQSMFFTMFRNYQQVIDDLHHT